MRFARRPQIVVALAALLLLATPAAGTPRRIEDCEAIKDASAYNLCLASFGPTRGDHGANYPGVASEGASRGRAATRAAHGARSQRRLESVGGRGGRVRMEFTPGR